MSSVLYSQVVNNKYAFQHTWRGPIGLAFFEGTFKGGSNCYGSDSLSVVSIAYDTNVRVAVRKAITLLGGISEFIHPGDQVVIKPNLVLAMPPFTGWVTDFLVVQAIIELCQQVNPKEIVIAEGSGGTDTDLAYRSGGYIELAKQCGVQLVDIHKSPTKKVSVPDGRTVQELNIPEIILECDALINVPKLKLYKQITKDRDWVSLSVKNLLGAIPGKGEYSDTCPSEFPIEVSPEFYSTEGRFYRPVYKKWFTPRGERLRIHRGLAHGLVDINAVIKPTLNILDGFIVSNDVNLSLIRGDTPFELNTILASQDPLALDCIAAKIGGIDIVKTIYLKHAADRGIGEADYDRIQVLGTPLKLIIGFWKTALEKSKKEN